LSAALVVLWSANAPGQSISSGTLEGAVHDGTGAPIAGARVVAIEVATGVSHAHFTDRHGGFRFRLLPPGDYDVFAEELGYQPKRVEGVPIRPAGRRHLTIRLETVDLPVDEVSVARFDLPAEDSRAGMSQWFSHLEIRALPEERRELTELARLSTISSPELATEGLPGWLSGVALNGMLHTPMRHPDLTAGKLAAVAFPLSAFSAAELINNAVDVEWSGAAGAFLSAYTLRGSRRHRVRAYGDWSGGAATSSDLFEGRELGTHTFRGAAVVSGPIIPDTAHYVLGFEAQRLELPLPRPWEITALDSALVAVAQDSFGVDLRPYTEPRVTSSELFSGFGQFDWQIAEGHSIGLRANFAALEVGGDVDIDPDLGPAHTASLGSVVDGWDLSGGATLSSIFSALVSQELRLSVDRSSREYTGTSVPGTRIVDGGLGYGTDPAIQGEFEQLEMRARETLHLTLPRHQLKFGASGFLASVDQRYSQSRGGEFIFAGADEFARLEGTFKQMIGAPPFAKFQNWGFGLFLQDAWSAAPGLQVLVGLRYDYLRLDRAEVQRNIEWEELTGLDNTDFDRSITGLSPRFGFRWDLGQRGEWLVRGSAGTYQDHVSHALFAEIVTHDGPVEFRRAVGVLDSWPDVPLAATAPTTGPRLSLLGPGFQPPRTGRASLGVTRLFPDRTAIHLSGTYRYTDHLPQRHDLNRPLAPTARDQHGRPIYGTLVKQGSLLAADPGSNRRFSDFDLVSALDADGVSSFWGGTIAVERHTGDWFDVIASYTLSRTEDDWLSGRGAGPEAELTPFPGNLNGQDWADARSDYDVPHRLAVGAQFKWASRPAGVRLAAFYRFESGQPFTPGFRDGVDVNADGSPFNDPAFVDPDVPGMEELLAEWDCLADLVGQFAERNSCRGPSTHRLDARVAVGFYDILDHPIEIVVDALNILDASTSVRDRALFLMDRDGTLDVGPEGTVTLPLVVNPNFGQALAQHTNGRALRLGIRVGL
jgi:hypothetical protein